MGKETISVGNLSKLKVEFISTMIIANYVTVEILVL
jgi:hypothetical protein